MKYLTFILIFFAIGAKCQEKDSLIFWSENYNLMIEDFRGMKEDSLDFATARSALQIEFYSFQNGNEKNRYYVFATFNRNKSFSLSRDSIIINHENLHFDIQELYVRKIRREFEKLDKNSDGYKSYHNILMKYKDSVRMAHEKYDRETARSHIRKKQHSWEKLIKTELNELNQYSAKKIYNIN